MNIYLMRHGEAGFNYPSDELRELTDVGREKVKRNILEKKSELLNIELILSSPLSRAKQTAEIAKKLLQYQGIIYEVDWLIHDMSPQNAIVQLAKYNADSVMLFSHQPFSSRFAEELCGMQTGSIAMNTASIIAIDADPVATGFGRVSWQIL